jgi:LPS sulfotransferase NodH
MNKVYLICTTMRTGGNLLCQYLTDTKLVGNPLDYSSPWYCFQFGILESGCRPITKDYVNRMIGNYSTAGVFGMKLPCLSAEEEIKSDTLKDLFPDNTLYIFLSRENKLQQAISTSVAHQTQRYLSNQRPLWSDDPSRKAQYSKEKLDEYIAEFSTQDAEWSAYFKRNQVDPLCLTYEELIANPKKVVKSVLKYVGVAIPARFELPPARLEKMADEKSIEWEARYRAR